MTHVHCSVSGNLVLVVVLGVGSKGPESVLNHFAPKMIAYSYIGMYCRYGIVQSYLIVLLVQYSLTDNVHVHLSDRFSRDSVSFKKSNISQYFSASIFLLQYISTSIYVGMYGFEVVMMPSKSR